MCSNAYCCSDQLGFASHLRMGVLKLLRALLPLSIALLITGCEADTSPVLSDPDSTATPTISPTETPPPTESASPTEIPKITFPMVSVPARPTTPATPTSTPLPTAAREPTPTPEPRTHKPFIVLDSSFIIKVPTQLETLERFPILDATANAVEQVNAGNGALAINIIDEAFDVYPGDYELYIWRASVYLSAFGDYELSLEDLARVSVAEINESNAYQYFRVALEAFLGIDEPVSAISLGEDLDRLEMYQAPLRVMLGIAYNRTSDYDSALQQFDLAIDDSSVYSPIYEMRAITYDRLGKTELAKKDRDRAIRLNQSGGNIYVRRTKIPSRTQAAVAAVTATPAATRTPKPIQTARTTTGPTATFTTKPQPTPWAMGSQSIRAVESLYGQEYQLTVLEFLAADDARDFLVERFSDFRALYDEPGKGDEYFLVRVTLQFASGGPPGTPFIFDSFDFDFVQLDGQEPALIFIPEDVRMEAHLKRGETKEGWLGGIRTKNEPILLGFRTRDVDDYLVFSFNCIDTTEANLRWPANDLCFPINGWPVPNNQGTSAVRSAPDSGTSPVPTRHTTDRDIILAYRADDGLSLLDIDAATLTSLPALLGLSDENIYGFGLSPSKKRLIIAYPIVTEDNFYLEDEVYLVDIGRLSFTHIDLGLTGCVFNAFKWSNDETKVMFSSTHLGGHVPTCENPSTHIVDVNSRALLAESTELPYSVFSADTTKVYAWEPSRQSDFGGPLGNSHVVIFDIANESLERLPVLIDERDETDGLLHLFTNLAVDWSPDRTSVAIWGLKQPGPPVNSRPAEGSESGIFIVSASDGKWRVNPSWIPVDGWIAERRLYWSPSGEYVAVLANVDDERSSDAYVIDVRAGHGLWLSSIVGGFVDFSNLTWSPEGSELAVVASSTEAEGKYLIMTDIPTQRYVLFSLGEDFETRGVVAMEKDGMRVAVGGCISECFDSMMSSIRILDAEDGSLQEFVTKSDRPSSYVRLFWLSDLQT